MKKIIFFILLFIANYTYSQVKVSSDGGIIATGLYPVADGNDIKGVPHEVQSIIDRNAIPANFRRLGMLAYVVDSSRYYQLKTGLTNSDWHELRGPDTTHVELPLYVDTANGVRTLKILHDDGLVSGGIVTKGVLDWNLDVTSSVYYIGGKAYSSSSSTATIDTADATYDRIDLIGVDTTGNVFVITGTPSANPIKPQINSSSQLSLTTITVKAASTFAPVITKIIYDEGTEWDTATSGTITATFNNEDNPYHGSKDIFVPTYENGGALELTDSGDDTATSNMVLKYFLYLNNAFTNSFQIQFFNDDDPVSNSLSFNSGYGLNPNNVNVYQNISIPFTSFVFSSNIFNKLKITMAGEDVSGAAGYYLDYIQLQKGIPQTGSGSCPLCIVDIHVTADSTYQVSIRQNGDTASVINWTGSDGGGITQSQLDDSTASAKAFSWNLSGNDNITSESFIGTTTNQPIRFKINNVLSGYISSTFNGNTSFGRNTLPEGSGTENQAFGTGALQKNTTGNNNSAIGHSTLLNNLSGNNNTANGWAAMGWDTSGIGNTALGWGAKNQVGSTLHNGGSYNTAIGYSALSDNWDNKYNIGLGALAGTGSTNSNTLYISDSTNHMNFKLDSAAGTAPSVIGKDGNGDWHVYQNSGGGGGSYQLPYNGNATDYLGGDTAYHALPTTPTLQQAFDASVVKGDGPKINAKLERLDIDSVGGFSLTNGSYDDNDYSSIEMSSGIEGLNKFSYQYDSLNSNVLLTAGIARIEASNSNSEEGHSITVGSDGIVLSDITNHSTIVSIPNADTLLTPPPYIWGVGINSTLKKVAVSTLFIDSTVTLTSGTITVSDTRVKTGARIYLSVNTPSGTQGFLSAKTSDIVDGTSFIINSTSATETSTINYTIINP